ncbi:MAG: hypothetical protein LBT59_26725 [Clostridiales bacterium]|nr:hypothetical protein [Clostridiales bacterium]
MNLHIQSNTFEDASNEAIKDYLETTYPGDIAFFLEHPLDILTTLQLAEHVLLKNAAKAMFAESPDLEAQMAIFATEEKLTFNDIKRHSGCVMQLIEISELYIRNTIMWRVVLDGSLERKEIPELPMEAVREALVNS